MDDKNLLTNIRNPETQVIISRTEKANSYEFGSAGNRFKLYFEEAADLLKKVKELRDSGFQIGFQIEITDSGLKLTQTRI